MTYVRAPFSDPVVQAINKFQDDSLNVAMTYTDTEHGRVKLFATTDGLRHPITGAIVRRWVPAWMVNLQ